MKIVMFVSLFLAAMTCSADEFYVASNVNSRSLDGLEFLLNGRPFVSKKVNVANSSVSGPASECIKAGTNVLSIQITERATKEMRAADKLKSPDEAKVSLKLVRKRDGALIDSTKLIEETFMVLPTNFVFTVTDDWPIKKFVWEGETPTLTEKDKFEIKELLDTFVGHAINMVDEYDEFLNVHVFIVEQEAKLKGMDVNTYTRSQYPGIKKRYSRGYSIKRPENKNIQYFTFRGINLVRISADNGKYGEKPIAAFREDMSGATIGPEWFSKINGKWWIVP